MYSEECVCVCVCVASPFSVSCLPRHPFTAGKMENYFPREEVVGVTSAILGSQSPAGRQQVRRLSAC